MLQPNQTQCKPLMRKVVVNVLTNQSAIIASWCPPPTSGAKVCWFSTRELPGRPEALFFYLEWAIMKERRRSRPPQSSSVVKESHKQMMAGCWLEECKREGKNRCRTRQRMWQKRRDISKTTARNRGIVFPSDTRHVWGSTGEQYFVRWPLDFDAFPCQVRPVQKHLLGPRLPEQTIIARLLCAFL